MASACVAEAPFKDEVSFQLKSLSAEGIQEFLKVLRKTLQVKILFDELCVSPVRTGIWVLTAHGEFSFMLVHADSSLVLQGPSRLVLIT